MPDGEGDDLGSDTLGHVARYSTQLALPNLRLLGLGNIAGTTAFEPTSVPEGAYGRCALAHPGADTYLGHQELMGGELSQVHYNLMAEVRDAVTGALREAGHSVGDMVDGLSPLLVDDCVLVADNIEARPRLNINVTASLDDIAFDQLTEVGNVVRGAVGVPRVIVVAGRGFDVEVMRQYIKERSPGQVGVDTPAMGVYDEHYQVRHLGVDLDTERQLASRVRSADLPVVLLGKAADVIKCPSATATNIVPSTEVLKAVNTHLGEIDRGLIVANVQETDLAGHEQDVERYAQVLQEVDRFLPQLHDRLLPGDVLFITADHGNDPTIGSSQHTREYTPLLVAGHWVKPVDLGTRSTLADVGATAAEFLDVGPLSTGESFLEELRQEA